MLWWARTFIGLGQSTRNNQLQQKISVRFNGTCQQNTTAIGEELGLLLNNKVTQSPMFATFLLLTA